MNKRLSFVILCGVLVAINAAALRNPTLEAQPAETEAHSVTLAEVIFLRGRGRTTFVDARPMRIYRGRCAAGSLVLASRRRASPT